MLRLCMLMQQQVALSNLSLKHVLPTREAKPSVLENEVQDLDCPRRRGKIYRMGWPCKPRLDLMLHLSKVQDEERRTLCSLMLSAQNREQTLGQTPVKLKDYIFHLDWEDL